jgi:hypothetical protein
MEPAWNLVNYGPFIATLREEAHRGAEEQRRRRACCKRKIEVAAQEPSRSDAVQGDAYLRAIMRMLDSYPGFARSSGQQRFHKCFLGATLPHIYGSHDFERHRQRILGEHDLDKVGGGFAPSGPQWGLRPQTPAL